MKQEIGIEISILIAINFNKSGNYRSGGVFMAKNSLLTIILCMLLLPVTAGGAEWVKIGNFHVDVSSIKQVAPNQYQVWYKNEFLNDDSLKEARVLMLFHCVERKYKYLQGTFYHKDGSIVTEGGSDWKYVIPESNYEEILNFVCTYKKGVLKIPKVNE